MTGRGSPSWVSLRRLQEAYPLAAATLMVAGNLALFFRLLPNGRRIGKLSGCPPPPGRSTAKLPRLSVIVPARNEEASLRFAAGSMLGQDYPNLEVVLVNDRSTDATGAIMAQLAAEHPGKVRVMTVETLPPGWLGKNYALWLGALQTSGKWLLFADADIVFDPTCFRRAVTYAEAIDIDHLALLPNVTAKGYWLNAFVAFFIYAFVSFQRPYLAADPKSKVGVGIGAFNLIRRAAYYAVGTHAAISLRPDDDMRLGLRVKRFGLRQQVLNGADLVKVDWYPSLGAALRGLEKNVFAGFDYSLVQMVAGVASGAFLTVAPYLWLWRSSGVLRRLLLGAIGIHTLNYVYANWPNRGEGWGAVRYAPVLPLTSVVFCYALIRVTWLTLRRGGMRWRETFYPLEQLRSQTGLEGISR